MRKHRYIGSLIGVAIGLATLVACGGGTTSTVKVTPANVSLATSAPLSATALSQQPVATSVPAPAGYTQSVSAALVTAAANTSVSIKEGNSSPSGVPALGFATKNGGGIQTMGKVRPMSAAVFNPVYYDVITPSASITVAGTVTFTQTFPAGTLASGVNYYLGFYDSTQASPAWQTISGPVTTSDDLTLAFSGTVSSFTLQANEAYGFVVFSTSNGSTPPPSQSQEAAYLSQGASGIAVVPESGPTSTIAIPSSGLALDDSGNIYNVWDPTPGPTAVATPASVIQRFAAGSTTANATYTSSAPAGSQTLVVASSGSGEFVGLWFNFTGPYPVINADVWNAGSTGGAPNYTLSFQYPCNFFFEVQHDGTIVAPQFDSTAGTISYQFFHPGSSTPYRTVPESVVSAVNQSMFCPNYATVGPDGTLYVTENSFGETDTEPDPYAGLYIVPPSGTETFVATTSDVNGPGPNGVDVDAVGNIYVANNNQVINYSECPEPTCQWTNDSLHDIEVFAPGGGSVLRHITGNYDPVPLVVAPDGTIFAGSFGAGNPVNNGINGTFVIPSGGSTISQVAPFGETTIVLYNGTQESAASNRRHSASFSGASIAAHSSGTNFAKFIQAIRRHYAH